VLTKIRDMQPGARQQLKVIFAISKKAKRKFTEKISVALALKMTHYRKRCWLFFCIYHPHSLGVSRVFFLTEKQPNHDRKAVRLGIKG
jgi:hypothetical protein